MMSQKTLRCACVQMSSTTSIERNKVAIAEALARAKAEEAECVFLPECCNLMQQDGERAYAQLGEERARTEEASSEVAFLANLAKQHGVWLHAGSLVFRHDSRAGKLVNRSLLFSPEGEEVARYDKIHLFDVDLGGGESYRESDHFQAGEKAVLATLPWGKLGMSVCYDLRFPRLYRHLAERGAVFFAVPSAFTVPTGRVHWQCLLRARAIENACFVFAAAQTGALEDGRKCWGHSMIVSPWGDILAEAGEGIGVIVAEIDLAQIEEVRARLPALAAERTFLSCE